MSEGSFPERARAVLDTPEPVALRTLTGRTVVVLVHALDVDGERVEVHLTTSVETWTRALDEGAFHTDLEPDEFRPPAGSPVEVVLVLRRPLAAHVESVDALADEFLGDGPSPLHQTEAWLLASVVQEVDVPGEPEATLAMGRRTGWARPFT